MAASPTDSRRCRPASSAAPGDPSPGLSTTVQGRPVSEAKALTVVGPGAGVDPMSTSSFGPSTLSCEPANDSVEIVATHVRRTDGSTASAVALSASVCHTTVTGVRSATTIGRSWPLRRRSFQIASAAIDRIPRSVEIGTARPVQRSICAAVNSQVARSTTQRPPRRSASSRTASRFSSSMRPDSASRSHAARRACRSAGAPSMATS